MPDAGLGQQHQRGRGLGIGLARRVGIGDRQVEQRQRRALPPFARPGDAVARFLAQQRDEVLAGHVRAGIAGGALGEAGAGDEDGVPPGSTSAAENPACASARPILPSRCRDRSPAGSAAAIAKKRQTRKSSPRPLRSASPRQRPAGPSTRSARPWPSRQAARAARARRSSEASSASSAGGAWRQAEPLLVAAVGADQPPGAIGDGDARIARARSRRLSPTSRAAPDRARARPDAAPAMAGARARPAQRARRRRPRRPAAVWSRTTARPGSDRARPRQSAASPARPANRQRAGGALISAPEARAGACALRLRATHQRQASAATR